MQEKRDQVDSVSAPLAAIEARIGYHFVRPDLLLTALTHPSFRNDHPETREDNQRGEFLGDAVLDLLLADQLFREHPDVDEGALTVLRSQCASGRALAAIAREIGLDKALRVAAGPDHDAQLARPRNLAAAVEALLGAAWLDGGLEAARVVYDRLFRERVARLDQDPWADNPKGELQALTQARGLPLPVYTVGQVDGPSHAPHYLVTVEVADARAAGEGGSKRAAEIDAARRWLDAHRGPPPVAEPA